MGNITLSDIPHVLSSPTFPTVSLSLSLLRLGILGKTLLYCLAALELLCLSWPFYLSPLPGPSGPVPLESCVEQWSGQWGGWVAVVTSTALTAQLGNIKQSSLCWHLPQSTESGFRKQEEETSLWHGITDSVKHHCLGIRTWTRWTLGSRPCSVRLTHTTDTWCTCQANWVP